MTEVELLAMFDRALTTLSHLVKVYDGGYHPIALPIATEVHKLLAQGGPATRLRTLRDFNTVDYGNERNMLNAMHKLVGARLSGVPPKIDFVADFQSGKSQPIALSFKDWWNKDVIYRASAALPGSPPGMIPVNDTPVVPFEKRETVNRRDFVALLRNTLGAHQDDDIPVLLENLEETRSWGSFVIQTPHGVFNTDDGTLKTGATMMAAMMRQIAHEVLTAYDRADPRDEGLFPS